MVACATRHELPATQVWDMSVADIGLSLKEPDEGWLRSDDQAGQLMHCLMLDERIARMKALTLDERVELARWKAELM